MYSLSETVLRTAIGPPKQPITPVRATTMTINRINKPKSRPVPRRSGDERRWSPRVSNDANKTVIGQVKEVIRCTPVRNEA